MKLLLLICLLPVCTCAFSQDFTNKGKDFWIGYGNHVRMATGGAPESMQLYITSDVDTRGEVSVPGAPGFPRPFIVTANRITTIDIPRTAALTGEGLYNTGIHVTAEKPVVVYSFIYVNAISGATLCLPTNTLGREYYSINFDQQSNEPGVAWSWFFAIAADTGTTTLEITPARNTRGGRPAGQPFIVTLQQGQVYQVLSDEDLTGSSIRTLNTGSGCKRIAVYCGSGKIAIGCGGPGTSDNLYQQMYSTATWGKTYITVPSINEPQRRSQVNYFRIFKSDPSAIVKLNGIEIPAASFVNGRYHTFSSSTPNHISSDKPIMVAQYFTTQGCPNSGEGDPDMIFLNPVEQTVSRVTLNSMQPVVGTNINQHFINVVLKQSPGAVNSFRIDGGAPPGLSFQPHPNAPGYVYAQIPVTAGTHTITCDSPFNAIAYGFGNAESYAYSAGTNLKDLYQFVTIKNDYASVNFPAGCVRSPFKFYITFPYQPVKITWRFNGLFPDTTIQSPVYDSTWVVNGRTLYRYLLDTSYQINTIGTYPISLLVVNPTVDGCSGEQLIEYDLEIFDRPRADALFTYTPCTAGPVQFQDNTNGLGRPAAMWYWDFGDGQPGSIDYSRSPEYTYTAAGKYMVRHSAITDIGCLSDTITKEVVITHPPQASFAPSSVLCEKRGSSFADQTTVSASTIVKWIWNFGDGSQLTAHQNNIIQHVYDTAGTYNVTLVAESGDGCISEPFTLPVTVHHLPHADFDLPEICINDPIAHFTDKSTIADGSTQLLTHHWEFGDGSTAAQQHGEHSYTATGLYQVKLTVVSKDGCVHSKTSPFVVNGSQPQAGFVVVAPDQLCSNQDVLITDASTVDYGSVVRVEIFWDYDNDPTISTIDEEPVRGKVYSHRYPYFGVPATKTFRIRYVAYSGMNCISQRDEVITVKASPGILFGNLAPVCEEAVPYLFKAASEIYGLVGKGTWSGPGTTSAGFFNPRTAGPGLHTIRYRFDAANGCSSEAEQQQLVYPTPKVSAGPDKRVLDGAQVQLDGQSNAARMVWSPALGLDNTEILTPKASPPDDITYVLTVYSAEGCTASDAVEVKVLRQPVIPNAFSPNGDGINDTWIIKNLEKYPDCIVEIYNRYGQRVYYSVGYTRPWDGTLNGRPLPVGTYYWVIHPKNGRPPGKGSVTIVR